MSACKVCGQDKAVSDFYVSDPTHCKACVRERVRVNRLEKIEYYREFDRKRGLLRHRKEAVRRRAPKYKDKDCARSKAFRAENPEKYKAHCMVNNAIRDGRLKVRPCERCGDAIGVQAHHEDYSKPLDVTWLCPKHHGERHRELNEQRRKGAA